ncbi:MAG: hypothetical protein KGD59_05960 [Candidatus Heimdallarchaeota archaeon]|nr:hypothetical protein [Candidatus Heimdallarchaeota archaeon]MBY8994077.1 hypothetical protein [Candidatus Heimdallarchaeota archaeon]
MTSKEKEEKITEEMISSIKELIGNRDEVSLEWLKTVTQLPLGAISRVIIQKLGMVVLEGTVFSKIKAERKLIQMQQDAQSVVDREQFRKGPVNIDMVSLREKLWTAMFNERIMGQERHQYCPIWKFLEDDSSSSIILRYDWIIRLDELIAKKEFNKLRVIEASSLENEFGENYKGKARVVFAHTFPRDSIFAKNKPIWVMFLVSTMEGGVKLEGLNMTNILTLSTKFRSRERAYDALSVYIELINFIVSDPSIFEEVIVVF